MTYAVLRTAAPYCSGYEALLVLTVFALMVWFWVQVVDVAEVAKVAERRKI